MNIRLCKPDFSFRFGVGVFVAEWYLGESLAKAAAQNVA